MTSMPFDFKLWRKESVKDLINAFVAQYTGAFESGINANPDVTLMIVFIDLKFVKSVVR